MKKLLVCLVTLVGCQQSGDKKNVEQVHTQVMAIHDEVMPRSEELEDLKEAISHHIDSLSKIKPVPGNFQARQQEGILINKALTEADSLMYDWMNNYKADSIKAMDEAQAKAYLELELKKITTVKEKINGGIRQAEKFLGN
ncbi:hypothetical protein [Larkinella knui]|uniref:Viral A-type inclusion protein n=1 Tax=Larkinella knui TaxID=2025310 RepID=A0A3P1CUV6_9BACT|nr:hypothetical protein [Larkinella knui]RRB17095.1 hypothetical protein EHT87_02105 [Larkinella knui]